MVNLQRSNNQFKYKQIKKRTKGKLKRHQLRASRASQLASHESLMTQPVKTWQLSLYLQYQMLTALPLPSSRYQIRALPR